MRSRIVRESKAACPIIFKYKTRQKSTHKKATLKSKTDSYRAIERKLDVDDQEENDK